MSAGSLLLAASDCELTFVSLLALCLSYNHLFISYLDMSMRSHPNSKLWYDDGIFLFQSPPTKDSSLLTAGRTAFVVVAGFVGITGLGIHVSQEFWLGLVR